MRLKAAKRTARVLNAFSLARLARSAVYPNTATASSLSMDRELLINYGIEPEYFDIWGRTHSTSDEVALAILKTLGVTDPQHAIEQHRAEWSHAIDPTIVVRDDADSIRVRIPADRAGASMKLEIQWETPDVGRGHAPPKNGGDPGQNLEHHWFWLPELRTIETVTAGGRESIAKRVPLPSPLPLGYHHLRLYWMQDPQLECFAEARLIVCPRQAMAPNGRMAGVALSLYGLRSSRNWGCGDFTDLRAAIDAFAEAGADFIALNPLHAIANRQPYNTSPYLPQSSLYRNYIYLDVERVGNLAIGDSMRREIEDLRASSLVEYERVADLKLATVGVLHQAFLADGGSPEFDRYVRSQGELLHTFAVYCALDFEMHRQNPNVWLWTEWPEEYRDPQSPAVARFAEEHRSLVQLFQFIQWHIDRQLAEAQAHAISKGMRIGLYHDLALATDRFGADLWANCSFYVAGARVGAPPDDFSPRGQDWSFPPPNRESHRQNGYELFAQSIRKNARHGGALRIDHVMRFFRLYWIPDGMDAASGAYVRDHADDLLGILALESVRGKFVVIGEDLGTVADEVRQKLGESGVLGYRVLWFSKHPDGSFQRPDEYPWQAAVSTTTHDLPTIAGFTAGRDIEARREAGLISESEYHERIAERAQEKARLDEALRSAGFEGNPIGFLLSTPCALAIVNQEDLTGEMEQQNLPGTTHEYPNWRHKMKVAVEDLGPIVETLRGAIARSGRR
jgi:4-alpha-glucanotransferase